MLRAYQALAVAGEGIAVGPGFLKQAVNGAAVLALQLAVNRIQRVDVFF